MSKISLTLGTAIGAPHLRPKMIQIVQKT